MGQSAKYLDRLAALWVEIDRLEKEVDCLLGSSQGSSIPAKGRDNGRVEAHLTHPDDHTQRRPPPTRKP